MLNIIIRKLFGNIGSAAERLIENLDNDKDVKLSLYDKIINIPKVNLFTYIVIMLVVFLFMREFTINLGHILSLLIGVVIINFLIQKDHLSVLKFRNDKKLQLDFLHKLMFNNNRHSKTIVGEAFFVKPNEKRSYLYMNPLIIQFYYNIKEFSQYNIDAYVTSLEHSNNIIGLSYQEDIGLNNPYENLTVAISEYKNALNALESMIYNLPPNLLVTNKLNEAVKILQSLLLDHIARIVNVCKNHGKKYGPSIHYKPDDMLDEIFKISADDTKDFNFNFSYNYF